MSDVLLVVQPSDDYAHRVRNAVPDAAFVATPDRAKLLIAHPNVIAADLSDARTAAAAVQTWARQNGHTPAGITTFICEAMAETALLAQELDLSFYSETLVQRTRDKHHTSMAWRRESVPTPATARIRDLNDLLDFASRTDGPWILKPIDGSGSAWVLHIHDDQELPQAHARLCAELAKPVYLAQQFISGREFSADLYIAGGQTHVLRLTEKYLVPVQGRAGLVGAYYPARVNAHTFERISDTFHRGVMALGIKRGIAMVDAILSNGKLYLLEMALRPGGDCLPDLCIHANGYDPIRAACEIALGQSPALPDIHQQAPVAALHLMTDKSGRIQKIDFTRLKKHPAVLHVEPYHSIGDELQCWAGSYDDSILAACIVQCANPNDLPVLVEMLTKRIDLKLEPIKEAQSA